MADLSINVHGKDAGASGVLKSTGESLGAVKVAAAGAAAALVAFARDSVKSFEAAERADRQLERAAGDLTQAFITQADALEATLGVNGDAVQEMQALLLTYGAAPSQIEATTKALLDYSAFTGEDAVAATRQLISSVDSGKVAFRELGVAYDATGSKTRDLEAATTGLAQAVGGAAQAESESLSGSAAKAEAALGKLKETFGGLLATSIQASGVMPLLTETFKEWNTALGGDSEAEHYKKLDALRGSLIALDKEIEAGAKDPLNLRGQLFKQIRDLERERLTPEGPEFLKQDRTTKQKKADDDALKDAERAKDKRAQIAWEETRIGEEEADKRLEQWKREAEALQKHEDEVGEAEADRRMAEQAWARWEIDMRAKNADDAAKVAEDVLKKQQDTLKHQEAAYAAAGAAIGSALISSLTSAIEGAASGEKDPGEVFGEVLATILGVAGSALGNVLLPGVGGALGGALGGLAGAGIKAATRRRHDGGWVDAPRYHGGAWVGTDEQPAILQSGERVLSRADVASMGGPSGVDSTVRGGRGGRGMTVNVSTFDGASAAEYFERAGGRALRDSIANGRGLTSLMFGT